MRVRGCGCWAGFGSGVWAAWPLFVAGAGVQAGVLLIAGWPGAGLAGWIAVDRGAALGGLAGALLIYGLTWALPGGRGLAWALLAAVDGTGHVLTRGLGLLLFAGHGWRCRRDGTSGGDGTGHGNFSRSAAVGGVELLPVLGGGLSHLALLGQSGGADLAGGQPIQRDVAGR